MVPSGDDDDLILFHGVDQPMLVGDATGPVAGELVLEGFGFADAGGRGAVHIGKQLVDALHRRPVGGDPVLVVVPAGIRESDYHSARVRALAVPARCCAMLSSRSSVER